MKRTTTRRRREVRHFITQNRRLFPFAGLFLAGVGGGVAIYMATRGAIPSRLLALTAIPHGAGGWLQALGNCCFSTVLLLTALFLFGLWSCGAPFILAIPLLHGVGLGMTEAYYYNQGGSGVATAAAAVMPVGLLTAVILATAGAQSLRMSMGLCRHLLSEEGGEPRRDFHLYCLRFLLLLAAALAVSLLDVMLRWVLIPA